MEHLSLLLFFSLLSYIGILENDEEEKEGIDGEENFENEVGDVGTSIVDFLILRRKKYYLATEK